MNETLKIKERKLIWIALSEFYLDTELQESDLRDIAFKIIESPYSLDEIKKINNYEVFPVLQPNLLSVAGEWAGIDEEWLIKNITDSLAKRNTIKKIGIESSYLSVKWMCKDYWEKLEKVYNQIKTNPNLFIVTCRELWQKGIEPFEFSKNHTDLFEKLKTIAVSYKYQKRLSDFYQNLQEGQYWINYWTACFIIEIFDLQKEDRLIGLNDSENIIKFCFKEVERHLPYLKSEVAKENCKKWLEKKTAYNKNYI